MNTEFDTLVVDFPQRGNSMNVTSSPAEWQQERS